MSSAQVVIIALGLAMDAFAVALGVGAAGFLRGRRAAFRISFHFGLFQFLMPVLGWFAGDRIEPAIAPVDHWIAFVLLAFVGGRMIYEGFTHSEESFQHDPTRGWTLVTLSVATSIDALAVGFSLAMIHVPIWYPSVIIGIITGSLSLLGMFIGHRVGVKLGKYMNFLGGILLVLIGARIVFAHLTGQGLNP